MRSHAIRKTASDRILNAINIGVLSLVLLVVLYPLYFVIIFVFRSQRGVQQAGALLARGFVLEEQPGFSPRPTSFGAAI